MPKSYARLKAVSSRRQTVNDKPWQAKEGDRFGLDAEGNVLVNGFNLTWMIDKLRDEKAQLEARIKELEGGDCEDWLGFYGLGGQPVTVRCEQDKGHEGFHCCEGVDNDDGRRYMIVWAQEARSGGRDEATNNR